ncbi:MAG: beta-ketoacyl-ACP synthase III [Rhizobiales bacterium TMED143]|nr:beta-ketoacyl-ACP synthase III [Rhodobiaceae bacterium]OUV93171.1 MAG: beta-ketoacyl-ACP synthase III [Rhizobiales bacterium TMED143]CAI8332480.1 MAG: Beta-ketodecanoyl-[acyl-carrier-protein] synthase [Rhodobiaceae bacterium UBA7378]|tara:strand:- start:407 stop:1531 length:1125 start_codon:yes stop_codon:yes gene_type:complete
MMKVHITGTGLFTPTESVSNEELVAAFNSYVENFNAENADDIENGSVEALAPSSVEFIEKASGIKSRFVMNKSGIIDPATMCPRLPERSNDEPSILAEMAVAATHEAMQQAGLESSDIDAVLVACSNLQRAYPAIAVEVQELLGIDGFGFDMNVACSSATFGIQTAYDMIRSGSAGRVLVVNPEICTGHLNFRDRDSHFIFGDVCTAIILEGEDVAGAGRGFEILDTRLITKFSNNIRNNFGFLNRTAPETVGAKDKLFVQEGRKVFREVVPMVAELIEQHLNDNNLQADNLRRMWLHQANRGMNDLIAKKVLGREPSEEEQPTVLDEYANTSSAGSIIAFHKHKADFDPGELGVICSFGAGYSAGSVIVRRLG